MEPEDVVTFLNRFLGKMIEILTDAHAVIDEIVGDGILAFFGAPEPMEDHPVRAVACALAMQAAMAEVNARNHADGLPHLEMGIAREYRGSVVGNMVPSRRTKYSVVGAHVKHRLPHRILCGGRTGPPRPPPLSGGCETSSPWGRPWRSG